MKKAKIEIKYCTGCKWMLRAAWMQQELLQTFEKEIESISLLPEKETGGVFDIKVNGAIVFSYKVSKRFPQPKEIKQHIRDIISPQKDLGHIDR
ncbi:SelT/SelW/SelH family protein [Aureibacter tunicatorum]|uniref:Selenoprotein W-related protein n=1 Tax=Aureibacter tunicatorum TaxID=866807 RepID=A0AAE4BSB7_9BACT|nr:SelT/SelW/SelH family protein [Aureibacter tunicatorum]MDR6238212.1 selenoprotein W-related protein [Aureibacter tunicatorum]BDD03245.1 hypothetical protein AUTU_07280 [Aureibacter tunicatorum]